LSATTIAHARANRRERRREVRLYLYRRHVHAFDNIGGVHLVDVSQRKDAALWRRQPRDRILEIGKLFRGRLLLEYTQNALANVLRQTGQAADEARAYRFSLSFASRCASLTNASRRSRRPYTRRAMAQP